jgi:hypothetical protein
VLSCTSSWACAGGYVEDRETDTGSALEICDGEDNDGDGEVDEGFGVGNECDAPGVCGSGTLECDGPFATRCSSGPGGSESRASDEVCDEEDNDCDGELNEGFGVGEPCALPLGCAGTRVCGDAGQTECAVNEPALGAEVCDGLDNDCDGVADFTVGDGQAFSACECVERRLSFGAAPIEASSLDETGFCSGVRPSCSDADGALSLVYCLDCGESLPYAMCVSEERLDLTSFVQGEGRIALTVRYSFQSTALAKSLVNLYYEVAPPADSDATSVRRYFRLLNVGDAPGTYTKTFFPEQTCYTSGIDCRGATEECASCRGDASCGTPTGGECEALSFTLSQLQLAVEDGCPADQISEGSIVIDELFLGPVPCDAQAHR